MTGEPFWRVVISDGKASGLAFSRNLRDAVLRAGRVIGLTDAELDPSIDTDKSVLIPTQSRGLYLQTAGRAKRNGTIEPMEARCPAVPSFRSIGCKPDPSHGGIRR